MTEIASGEAEALFCTVHPKAHTSLRCNKCGRPMCIRCAVQTPVGYRCKECVRGQQAIFFNARPLDLVIQAAISIPLSAVAATAVGLISFGGFYLVFFIGVGASSFAGVLIADLAHRAVGKRRGRYSWLVVAASIVVGALIPALVGLVITTFRVISTVPIGAAVPIFSLVGFFDIGWWIYVVVGTAAAIGRLRLRW